MGPQTVKLVAVLDDIIAILEADDETHWCSWMKRAKARLINSDYSGIEYLLSSYGGMGSFNDLVIGQTLINDEFAWKPDYQQLNDKLHHLRGQAYELATWIKRSHEINNA